MDDYGYNVLAYRLADKAVNDITVITVRDDNEKICLEVSGELDQEKTNAVLRTKQPEFNPSNVAQIAEKIKRELPKSMYETDSTIPLLYVDDIEYYNGSASSAFTGKITEKLAFEPRILVTETRELADYFLKPRLLLSKIEPVNAENSRYSMSVVVELRKSDGSLVDSEEQNRYIIVNNNENMQETAQKLLTKLLEDALTALSGKLNSLLKY